MITGTIQSASLVVIKDQEHGVLQLAFTNTSGGELKTGQEVKFKTDGTVEARNAATDIPIGVLLEGVANNEKGVVRVYFKETVTGAAKGGTLNPGDAVRQDATVDADGRPNYVAASGVDHVATGIVINGGLVTEEILVGSLQSPLRMLSV